MTTAKKKKPLYCLIIDDIKEKINMAEYKVGEMLPTETELQQIYNASRTTVRKAVDVLIDEGYLSRKQGVGTVLISRVATQHLNSISSFSETLKKKGIKATTEILSIRKTLPSDELATKLEISDTDYIYSIQRCKIVEGKVFAFLNNHIVADVVPGLENYSEYLRNHGLYETLEKHYKLEMGIAFETISVIMSNDFMNDLFGTNAFVPLFKNERITKLTNGKVFESVTSYIRTENFNYSVILNGRK